VLRATDTNPNLDPGFAAFNINTATASKLAFTQQPTNANAGVAISPAVTVGVEDANGNIVTTDSSNVTLTLSSGTFASGSNTATVVAVNGVATFSNLVINAGGTYTLAASDGTLTGATSNSFTITATQTVTTVDDLVSGTGLNQFNYVGAWTHVPNTDIVGSFNGSVSYTDTTNDSATITFNGTQIKFYIARRSNRGIAAVSIDGGPETLIDEYGATDAGNVLVYTSPVLSAGTHTFKVRNTGTHNASSTGFRVDIDRVDIIS
jgi:hypothetical protein